MTLAWHLALSHMEFGEALGALRRVLARSKYPPTPADVAEEIQTSNVGTWVDGWKRMMDAVRLYGSYEPERALATLDPITRQVAQALGWRNICMSEEAELSVLRAQFQRMWETVQMRRRVQELPQLADTAISALLRSGSDLLPVPSDDEDDTIVE